MSSFESYVNNDYKTLLSNVELPVDRTTKELLLMQSIIGHAQHGHAEFKRTKFPNATLDDVVLALNKDPIKIRKKRQNIINSIFDFTNGIIDSPDYPGYVSLDGEPLISLKYNWKMEDPAAVLTGIYLGSIMDNFGWRQRTTHQYGINIGGGECVAINLKSEDFRMRGLTLDKLANGELSKKYFHELEKSGVIISNETTAVTNEIINAFVRKKKGNGPSDDLAILLAGKLYGNDAAIGVFLCDAVDTWDKYSEKIIPRGQDEQLGRMIYRQQDLIKKTYPDFNLPSDEEVTKFIFTISLKKARRRAISSSQRYLLQVAKKTDQSAIKSHLNYIVGQPYKPMRLGHINSKLTNNDLYRYFEGRFEDNYLRI